MQTGTCEVCGAKISCNYDPECVYGGIDFKNNMIVCFKCFRTPEWKLRVEQRKQEDEFILALMKYYEIEEVE
jgi:hypothetical protein